MTYPILLPEGDFGWHPEYKKDFSKGQKKTK
jgi:hypothetical protein